MINLWKYRFSRTCLRRRSILPSARFSFLKQFHPLTVSLFFYNTPFPLFSLPVLSSAHPIAFHFLSLPFSSFLSFSLYMKRRTTFPLALFSFFYHPPPLPLTPIFHLLTPSLPPLTSVSLTSDIFVVYTLWMVIFLVH